MRVSVCIGGLDPTGGAGLLADARTAWHHEFHPAAIVTALTAQGDKGVTWWEPVAPAHVVEQLEAVLFGSPVAAVKLGMRTGRAGGLVEGRPGDDGRVVPITQDDFGPFPKMIVVC